MKVAASPRTVAMSSGNANKTGSSTTAHKSHGHSRSSGLTGCGSGITDFFSTSRERAFLISVHRNNDNSNAVPETPQKTEVQ